MVAILGISAFFHDAAAALVVEGEIVAAAEEERFSRRKHDASFPRGAIRACLDAAGLGLRDIDYVVFYEKPLLKFDRLIETHLATAPLSFPPFRRALPRWLSGRLNERKSLLRELGPDFRGEILFVDHHAAHAASAFFPSPFADAAIVTADGVGEWSTTTIAKGSGSSIEMLQEQRFPHSLGLLYNAFTQFLGFEVNEGEYKVMGLAPYGEPRFEEKILSEMLDLKPDGSFRLDLDFFGFLGGLEMISRRFSDLFGPPRLPGAPLTKRDVDLAASIQSVTEAIFLRVARAAKERTGAKNLCLAGGCAHNSVAAGRLFKERIFDEIWIQPAAGDSGGALGAALFAHHVLLGRERSIPTNQDAMRGAWLGPDYSDKRIRAALAEDSAPFETFPGEDELLSRVAAALASGKIVGWFQGRMEYGPRALGARSILADPRSPEMNERVNRSVKMREAFRPFAPSVLRVKTHEWFEVPEGVDMPYMTFVVPVRADLLGGERIARPNLPPEGGLPEDALRAISRGPIPAVTHVDGTARIQTVDERHGRYHRLLRTFYETTGCSVLLDTSFNVRGEPIVNTPEDALRCLRGTEIDLLVLGDHLVEKPKNKSALPPAKEAPSPSPAELRRFGLSFGASLCSLGAILSFKTSTWTPAYVLGPLALLFALVCLAAPPLGRLLFRAVRAFGALLATIVLALIYFLLFTPFALALRLAGRDPLDRSKDPAAATYFREKRLPNDPSRAFHPY